MPCTSYGFSEQEEMRMREDGTWMVTPSSDDKTAEAIYKVEIAKKVEKIDHLTQMLCKLCEITGALPDVQMPEQVRQWWEEHKALDKRRIKSELADCAINLKYLEQQAKELNAKIEQQKRTAQELAAEEQRILNRK